MTYTDEKVDLVINKMTQAQYESAKQAGTLSQSELYITDQAMPSKTSDLVNDSGFITASAIPSNVGAFNNDVGYLTASTMPPIPSQTSDLVNNSGFITASALSGYATTSYVDAQIGSVLTEQV